MSTFDSGLPAANTKIKNYPEVLQNNFAGIEQGDQTFQVWQENFVDRTTILPAPPTAVPAVIADNMILYATDDGTDTELFCLDTDGNEIQLTQDGKLGSSTTVLNATSLNIGSTPLSIGINQMIVACGSFNANGTIISAINLTAVPQFDTGKYQVNVNADVLTTNNYIVIGTVFNEGAIDAYGSERVLTVTYKGVPVAATPTLIQYGTRSGSGTSSNNKHFLIVIGGR